ncbi:MAG: rod-binding protein [Paracoccus sp. (in: a-proteobacteria)]|nr:rod-binding protein [Paracoccus sp. (in: a-proteobacteria)]
MNQDFHASSISVTMSNPVHYTQAPADMLEQMFLEEMLKHCGPGALTGPFSGGAGEEQFASFLTREHAAILARRIDLGFDVMLARQGAA